MGTNIIFWNCQGVRQKCKELELYLKENNVHIVALHETFLTKKIDSKIQGYDTTKNDRSTGDRDGVTFLVKHDQNLTTDKTRNPSSLMTLLYGLPVKMYDLQQNFCIRTYKTWQSGVPNGE